MDRPCSECIWHNGESCSSWECEPVTREQAREIFKQKTGKWIIVWHEIFRTNLPACSRCGEYSVYKTPYCPHCGSRMEEQA